MTQVDFVKQLICCKIKRIHKINTFRVIGVNGKFVSLDKIAKRFFSYSDTTLFINVCTILSFAVFESSSFIISTHILKCALYKYTFKYLCIQIFMF